jgi:hypothetical protein
MSDLDTNDEEEEKAQKDLETPTRAKNTNKAQNPSMEEKKMYRVFGVKTSLWAFFCWRL